MPATTHKTGATLISLLPTGINFIFSYQRVFSTEKQDDVYSRTLDCEQLGLRVFYKTSKNFEGILT
jgi:hypothetical protein